MNEDTASWLVIGLVIIAMFCCGCFKLYLNHETETEAIKAGLVQDDNGHWVQPIVRKEKLNEN